MQKLKRNAKGQSAKLRQCYVYEIRVDGVVRYIGKGCNDRIYSHLIEAKRTASRPGVKIRNLSPHFRKMLVSAVRRGLNITEKIISSKLTDAEAYKMEWQLIWDYHKRRAGQLWNTIDERGRNPLTMAVLTHCFSCGVKAQGNRQCPPSRARLART